MRPRLDNNPPTVVVTDYGIIPWDAVNNRPLDFSGQAGELYARALADNGMTSPDPYVPDPSIACAAIDAFRDARLSDGFADTTTNKTWQCDADSNVSWLGLSQAAALGVQSSFDLIADDNSVVTLSAPDTAALMVRLFKWVSATMLYARTLKNNVLAGAPPADITQGWPI